MEAGSHPERDKTRYPFTGNILINGKIMVKGIDISMGGVYVYTGRSFGRGRIVDVTIPDFNFTVKARVQHDQPGVGSGLKFMGMGDELKNKLRLMLQSLDTSAADYSMKTKPEVLLIDQNQSSRRINKSKLSMEGFFVLEANDGAEALKKLRDRTPDVIVCDMKIEGIDGIKLLSMIRSTPEWSHVPVIMMSTDSSSEIVDRAYEAGASDLLVKGTTTPAKLAEHITGILEKNTR
jgi:two-component system chemotaxis response regulator CheY